MDEVTNDTPDAAATADPAAVEPEPETITPAVALPDAAPAAVEPIPADVPTPYTPEPEVGESPDWYEKTGSQTGPDEDQQLAQAFLRLGIVQTRLLERILWATGGRFDFIDTMVADAVDRANSLLS